MEAEPEVSEPGPEPRGESRPCFFTDADLRDMWREIQADYEEDLKGRMKDGD